MSVRVIHILGASGSGTTTLGKAIGQAFHYRHLDVDDFFWESTDPPFTTPRERKKRVALLREAIESEKSCVVSGSLCGWGDVFIPSFDLVILVETPTDIRISRLQEREYKRFGDRISEGGDMYQAHLEFIEWAKSYDTGDTSIRSKALHELWLKGIACPKIRFDGTAPLGDTFEFLKEYL